MLPKLESENKIFFTEAPAGAMRGWVKFLVGNCPLPFVLNVKVIGEEVIIPPPDTGTNIGDCMTCSCSRAATMISINGDLNPIWLDEGSNDANGEGVGNAIDTRVLKFKVGDNVVIRATSGTMHGVSLRLDGMESNTTLDTNKTLEQMQNEVLDELKEKVTVNNEEDLENNITAMTDDLINFHGGIPITFTQKAVANPGAFPDGVPIADLTINEGSEGLTGTVGCTVHGSAMSFKFEVCE